VFRSKSPAEQVRDVALMALASALQEQVENRQRRKPKFGGVRALAAGAVLYTAGRAVAPRLREQLESAQQGGDEEERRDDEDAREEEPAEDEPRARSEEDEEEYEDDEEEPVAEAEEDDAYDDEEAGEEQPARERPRRSRSPVGRT
jgi:hypothetical protein